MLRRIALAITATLALILPAAAFQVMTAAPAHAASATTCREVLGIKHCVTITFVPKDVVVTSVGHSTPVGCGKLEPNNGKYAYKDLSTNRGYYHWGAQACSGSVALYDVCGGCPARNVTVYMRARVGGLPDRDITAEFHLNNNGTWSGQLTVAV